MTLTHISYCSNLDCEEYRIYIKLKQPQMSLIQKSRFGPVHIPDNLSYPDLILRRAAQHGDNIALIDAKTGHQMTYKTLEQYCRRLASSLYRRGIQKNDIILIVSPNHVYYAVALVSIGYIGGITSTANPNYTAEELEYMIEDCQCTRIITCSRVLNTVKAAITGHQQIKDIYVFDEAPGHVSVRTLVDEGDAAFVSRVEIRPRDDTLYLPYSSGTTGRSKGVMLTHYNIVANVCQGLHPALAIGPRPHETFIAFLPFYHVYALSVILALGFTRGDTIVVIEKYNLKLYLDCIRKYKATFLHVVPPVALELAKNSLSREYMTSVHTFYCGAAPLGPPVEKNVLHKTGVPTFRQGYGLTETGPNTHVAPVNGWKHGSCGMLVPNTECKIRDSDTDESLGPNKDGELMIRGPQVMKGYWRNTAATAGVIDTDGWFHTGDIGYYDEDGHFYVIDRLKELIKWKGIQVPPAEVEHVILKHESVMDTAVVGVPDDEAGEIPKAYVVVKPGVSVTHDDIVDFVAAHVSPHKRLRGGVEFVAEIPKSPSGKILRRTLRDIARNKARQTIANKPPPAKL